MARNLQFKIQNDIAHLIFNLSDEPTGRLALVFELMDMNMYECIRGRRHYLAETKVFAIYSITSYSATITM